MAKIPFSKLSLKKKDNIEIVKINDLNIEVKQYLPVNDKLNLIGRVLMNSADENYFSNPVKIETVGAVEIIMAYTNLSFTEKQKEDIAKLYDLLESNGIINKIIEAIPTEEYNFLIEGIDATVESVYTYRNSIYGILDTISQDYSNLNFNIEDISKKLANGENIELVKNIVTKLG